MHALLNNILPVSARAEGLRHEAVVTKNLVRYNLEAIRAPTLIVSARDDGYGTYASAQYTASQIAGAKFIGFDQGGHVFVGHDEQMRREILKLLITLPLPLSSLQLVAARCSPIHREAF